MPPYPVLNNRPIDQWKVTELKEELRRRKLTVKGLKDDLIRRLDEAIRVESEIAAKEAEEREKVAAEVANKDLNADPESGGTTEANVVDFVVQEVDVNDVQKSAEQGKPGVLVGGVEKGSEQATIERTNVQDPGTQGQGNSNVLLDSEDSKRLLETKNIKPQAEAEDLKPPHEDPLPESTAPVEEKGNSNVHLDSEDTKRQLEVKNSKSHVEAEDLKPPHGDPPLLESTSLRKEKGDSDIQLDNEDANRHLETKNSKPQVKAEDLKPPHEDVLPESTAPDNQVSEVNPNLGFHVKSDSISTSLVSNNENNELKVNKTSDNIKIELDVSNAEMVEPSLSDVVPDGGDSHPTDVEEPKTKASAEEKDEGIATKGNVCKKNVSIDMGSLGKLNIDGSSGDDSMEEDPLESKLVDSQDNSDEVGSNNAKSVVPSSGEKMLVDVAGKYSPPGQKQSSIEYKNSHAVPSEKRKLDDRDSDGNTELSKKQRRWNHKIPEPQSSNRQPTATPKEASQTTDLRCNLTKSTSAVSEEAPKERAVPPSSKMPTNSLRIDNFLRPFTLKAVQDLLGKTGSVSSFWMDQIKTHCYVMYSSTEEAIVTRNVLYNLQWPPNGGRLLVAEFVDPHEVKMRLDAPHSAAPVTPGVTPPAASTQLHPTPRQQAEQQLPPPPPLAHPPSLSNKPFGQPAPSAMQERHEPPIVTLDDLFKKTKATPRIYYLPLSEDQVAKKIAERNRRASIRN